MDNNENNTITNFFMQKLNQAGIECDEESAEYYLLIWKTVYPDEYFKWKLEQVLSED